MVVALLDSVILIDHLNGISVATEWFAGEGWDRMAISASTRVEIMAGAKPEEVVYIGNQLDSFPCLSQAALVEIYHLKLITRNTRDFFTEEFDYVVIPYRL